MKQTFTIECVACEKSVEVKAHSRLGAINNAAGTKGWSLRHGKAVCVECKGRLEA